MPWRKTPIDVQVITAATSFHRGSSGAISRPCSIAAAASRPTAESPAVSKASTAATREAGLSSGGDVELDGLVRAFVAAGGRTVLASHWPVPDDFNATQRLITGLFSAPAGTPTVTALRMSQRQLMDDVNTSHPFYWSAFAVVGDGEIPVIRAKQQIAQR